MSLSTSSLVAVDIGNSRIKLGLFDRGRSNDVQHELPEPIDTLELPIAFRTGEFDAGRFTAWCTEHADDGIRWLVASVHQGAFEQFHAAVTHLAAQLAAGWAVRRLSFLDIPLHIRLDEPSRVGTDRLLAALAADRLRRRDRAAVVVDLGSAMTVDLVSADGAFEGGAILPGISMSARALSEQTDALPCVETNQLGSPPAPLGKSTVAAIEAGLYWGAVGAIREFIRRLSIGQTVPPDVFLTGGASSLVAGLLSQTGAAEKSDTLLSVRHVPHMVLAGIALVDEAVPER